MIRKALFNDMDSILRIVEDVKRMMNESGNDQWSDSYPLFEDFSNDIRREELFVDVGENGDIRSFICLNRIQLP